MNLHEAEKLARTLMDSHTLRHWHFKFDRAKTRHGQCDSAQRTISLSRYFAELNDEPLVRETILHEIAHAIVGPAQGHGPRWQALARQLGVRPVARKASAMPKGRYRGSCGCTADHNLHRRPKAQYRCRLCGTMIAWADTGSTT